MIKQYDPDQSPTNLSLPEAVGLAAGRRALGVQNLGDYSVHRVVKEGARTLRGVALAGAGILAVASFSGPSSSAEGHNRVPAPITQPAHGHPSADKLVLPAADNFHVPTESTP